MSVTRQRKWPERGREMESDQKVASTDLICQSLLQSPSEITTASSRILRPGRQETELWPMAFSFLMNLAGSFGNGQQMVYTLQNRLMKFSTLVLTVI